VEDSEEEDGDDFPVSEDGSDVSMGDRDAIPESDDEGGGNDPMEESGEEGDDHLVCQKWVSFPGCVLVCGLSFSGKGVSWILSGSSKTILVMLTCEQS